MLNDDDDDASLWSRRFDFEDGSSNCVEEEWNAGIGGTVWEGGVLLARFLSSPVFASLEGLPKGRQLRAIELGCGVSALPCLVAARLQTSSSSASSTSSASASASASTSASSSSSSSRCLPLFSEIYATDIDECLPGLEANAKKNLGNEVSGASVEVVRDRPWETEEEEEDEEQQKDEKQTTTTSEKDNKTTTTTTTSSSSVLKLLDLDWRLFPRAAPHLGAPFDVVLVADAVYISSLMPALVGALRCASGPDSVVLLAYYLRSESADAEFWPRLEAAFEVGEAIPAASFGCEGADKGGAEEGGGGGEGGGKKIHRRRRQQRRGLFRLRKRSEEDYERLEEERRRKSEEEGEEEDDDGDDVDEDVDDKDGKSKGES